MYACTIKDQSSVDDGAIIGTGNKYTVSIELKITGYTEFIECGSIRIAIGQVEPATGLGKITSYIHDDFIKCS